MTTLIRCPLLLLLTLSMVTATRPGTARAEESEQIVLIGSGTPEERLAQCREHFFPELEVRYLSEIPIEVLIAYLENAGWTYGPAAGLNVLGLWWTPARPECRRGVDEQHFVGPREGLTFSLAASGNATLTSFGVSRQVVINVPNPDPTMMPLSGETTVSANATGMALGLIGGLYLQYNWRSGGHGNHVGLGVVIRGGALIEFGGSTRAMFSIGPVLELAIY